LKWFVFIYAKKTEDKSYTQGKSEDQCPIQGENAAWVVFYQTAGISRKDNPNKVRDPMVTEVSAGRSNCRRVPYKLAGLSALNPTEKTVCKTKAHQNINKIWELTLGIKAQAEGKVSRKHKDHKVQDKEWNAHPL
jgi:hypothetical protein